MAKEGSLHLVRVELRAAGREWQQRQANKSQPFMRRFSQAPQHGLGCVSPSLSLPPSRLSLPFTHVVPIHLSFQRMQRTRHNAVYTHHHCYPGLDPSPHCRTVAALPHSVITVVTTSARSDIGPCAASSPGP
jgi:hypothetical protein